MRSLIRRLLRSPIVIVPLLGLALLAWMRLDAAKPTPPRGGAADPSWQRPAEPPAPRPGADAPWREPAATLAPTPTPLQGCRAVDGDTLHCGAIRVRLRGVDTPERNEPRYREAGRALQAMVDQCRAGLTLLPHHRSHDRIVGDVLCAGTNLGHAMDAAGWSKPVGARR